MAKGNCENCSHYVFDDEAECCICEINLDEDEMYRFLSGSNFDCHYFDLDDEYKIVRKQN
ncbi:MAG: DUF6472 family protein [Ruminococcus sp.]